MALNMAEETQPNAVGATLDFCTVHTYRALPMPLTVASFRSWIGHMYAMASRSDGREYPARSATPISSAVPL
jgi:hypothetical protein